MKKILLISLLFIIIFAFSVEAQRLQFSMLSQDPDPVHAGDVVEVRLKVENEWDETSENVEIEILPEYPFSLYQTKARKDLGRLESRKRYDATFFHFKLKIDENAVDGDHELKFRVHEGDTTWTLEDMFYVDIEREKLEIKPYIVASDLIIGGVRGRFTVEIANTGGQDIEALQLQLKDASDYKLLSTSNYVYLGDLESDDTESEDFTVYVEEGTKEVRIPLTLLYEANDRDYKEDFNLILPLLSKEEAIKVGLISETNLGVTLGSIIAVIIVFFLARYYIKRKKR